MDQYIASWCYRDCHHVHFFFLWQIVVFSWSLCFLGEFHICLYRTAGSAAVSALASLVTEKILKGPGKGRCVRQGDGVLKKTAKRWGTPSCFHASSYQLFGVWLFFLKCYNWTTTGPDVFSSLFVVALTVPSNSLIWLVEVGSVDFGVCSSNKYIIWKENEEEAFQLKSQNDPRVELLMLLKSVQEPWILIAMHGPYCLDKFGDGGRWTSFLSLTVKKTFSKAFPRLLMPSMRRHDWIVLDITELN